MKLISFLSVFFMANFYLSKDNEDAIVVRKRRYDYDFSDYCKPVQIPA